MSLLEKSRMRGRDPGAMRCSRRRRPWLSAKSPEARILARRCLAPEERTPMSTEKDASSRTKRSSENPIVSVSVHQKAGFQQLGEKKKEGHVSRQQPQFTMLARPTKSKDKAGKARTAVNGCQLASLSISVKSVYSSFLVKPRNSCWLLIQPLHVVGHRRLNSVKESVPKATHDNFKAVRKSLAEVGIWQLYSKDGAYPSEQMRRL